MLVKPQHKEHGHDHLRLPPTTSTDTCEFKFQSITNFLATGLATSFLYRSFNQQPSAVALVLLIAVVTVRGRVGFLGRESTHVGFRLGCSVVCAACFEAQARQHYHLTTAKVLCHGASGACLKPVEQASCRLQVPLPAGQQQQLAPATAATPLLLHRQHGSASLLSVAE